MTTIQELYEDGRFSEALKKIASDYPPSCLMPIDVVVIKAWCHYRLGDYAEATKTALAAYENGSIKGEELLAQLAAYVSKDDELIMNIHQKLPNNPSVCNALAIRARDADSNIPLELILRATLRMARDNRIGAVHLANNTARALLAKGKYLCDVFIAIGLWETCRLRYGDKNYHHRAAVHFWLSHAYERAGEHPLAVDNAEDSVTLWEQQVVLDPENIKFKEGLEGARKRLDELTKSTIK
jgi:tetratricopeptide (TPR) repeat protein